VPTGETTRSIGISVPTPQASSGYVRFAANFPTWHDLPLAQLVSDGLGGVPTHMENDANLAALAEYHQGAGRGANPMVYLTISTGIGGGAVIDGKLFTGHGGLALEPGHVKFLYSDGQIYSLEKMASGTGVGWLARNHLAASDKPSLLRSVKTVDAKAVGEAAHHGDALALAVLDEAGQWLGLGLINMLLMFNPEVIVLGGSAMRLGDLILNPARRTIEQYVIDPSYYKSEMIRIAQLGDDVGLIGAASLAREKL
jgi:glucokinase